MKEFRELSPEDKVLEPIRMIGKEWMLIGAKKPTGEMNAMTASWGGIGVLFHKPVVFCFVRPQRYTDEFLQASGYATCSFLPESSSKLRQCILAIMPMPLFIAKRLASISFSPPNSSQITACGDIALTALIIPSLLR